MTLSPISIDNVRQLLKLAELPISDVDEVAFSLDNQYLACGRYNGVVLLDYISGRIVHSFSTKEPVSHLSYSSRGEYLAGIANGLYVWSANSLELISKHPGSGYHNHYMDLRFVSDQQGERLLIAHLDKIEVLDTSSWRIVGESQCRDDIIGYQTISLDGSYILTLDEPDFAPADRPVTLWSRESCGVQWNHIIASTGSVGLPTGTCFHPSKPLVAIGEEGHITIWRVPEGGLVSEPRFERESAAPSLAFSPNGQLLAAGLMRGVAQGGGEDVSVDFTYTCTLWDWEWGAQLHQLPDFGKELAFSPDGSRLVITNYDGVQIWAIQQGTTRNETNRLCGNGDDVLDYDNQGRSSDHPNYGDDW